MAIDFEQEGLLEGLEGPARQARLELLTRANTTEAAAPLVALIKDIASAIATLRSLQ